ncbi:MAG: hypothetical protein ACRCZF_25450, partial [Gemmataceae bacterium]
IVEAPDTIIATVNNPDATFADLAAAIAPLAKLLEDEGRLILLTPANPEPGRGMALLRTFDEPRKAIRRLSKEPTDDAYTAIQWAGAAARSRLFVGGSALRESAEEIFALAIDDAADLQRVADAAQKLLVVPNAHRTRIELQLPDEDDMDDDEDTE